MDDEKTKAIERVTSCARREAKLALEMAEKAAKIFALLPFDIIDNSVIVTSGPWIQFCHCDRQQTQTILRSLNAGRWEKKLNREFIDYEADVNGVHVIIYAAPPPGSCRIIEEKIEVPATTITKRTLVCAK